MCELYNYIQLCWTAELYKVVLDCTIIYSCVGLHNYIQLCCTVQLYTVVLDCKIK